MSKDPNKRIDEALADWKAPFPSKEASWERLMLRIEADQAETPKKNKRFLSFAVAASVAFIMAFVVMMQDDMVRFETQLAEQQTITLPEGSQVIMNAASRIEYDEDEFTSTRTLTLDGEAFFKVKKGSKFDVVTDQGTVTVLGTSFNVCDRGGFLEVTCETGKVQVSHDGQAVILEPGWATNNRKGALSERYDKTDSQSWTRGLFQFEEQPVNFVFDEVEREFGVDIQAQGAEQELFSGEFESTDLETAMTVICQPLGLEFDISEDRQIVVTKK